MASHQDFVNYVAEQLREAGSHPQPENVRRIRPLLRRCLFAVICDDQFLRKGHSGRGGGLPDLPKAPPYEGPGITSGWRMWMTRIP